MKFIVSSSTLLKKLQILGGVINTSNTIPVLDHFLFDLDNSKLKITSSDLETTMISSIDVDSSSKGSGNSKITFFIFKCTVTLLIFFIKYLEGNLIN